MDRFGVARLLDAYRKRSWTIAVAESCTGGELCTQLSALPGSSDVFRGGVIPYADSAKTGLLGVPLELIVSHGAVSAEVALAMALGVRERLGADVGVALTGIAGPGGARPNKPVGLVFIAISGPFSDDQVHRREWHGSRDENRAHSVWCALELLASAAKQDDTY
ncbi:MAG: CinA family protein [Chloroflexota bacterium]